MINTILTAILTTAVVFQTAIFVIFLCKLAMVFREFVSFITPAGENMASPAGNLWAEMAKQLVLQFKTTIMGLMSVQTKIEKRAEDEMVQNAVAIKNPLAGAALSAFPKLRKLFMKNPAIIEYALSKMASGSASSGPDHGHNPDDYAVRLGKYT